MAFSTILYPDQFYTFQNDLKIIYKKVYKNIPNEVTLNMEAAFKQELQRQAYPFLVQSV